MNEEPRDPIAQALMAMPAAPLDVRRSERVLAVARANLEREVPGPARWMAPKLTLARALVPTLLASAAAARGFETVTVAQKIYGARAAESDAPAAGPSPHR